MIPWALGKSKMVPLLHKILISEFLSTLTLNGQEWKERRAKLTPIFTSGKVKMMFEIVDIISNKLVRILGNESVKSNNLEMLIWLQKFTIDSIGNVAFGIEPNCKIYQSQY